ncbi:hypothetical protein AM501_18805 [Aneurinibacillus migulanus]|uniref:hypothetical protein n=1 Tax=Aneurinibacillus migulanus TaxID=47500 RepID=UPI0006B51390|nr:hypothetical protein [Aneurinibacillus migulanus]KPD06685.1 hypothetical protein AM501_18805 [Aneurinibacillus migulanus]MCP1354325.1 hypothetical protein [Aneurinibacillus migulanus]MED0891420.1 hypothetical protein [Aneurinibacillus migulanus]MED1613891.1 hypothetical protein [Aneurinibacillus migulanus]MED4728828.1 hypothetical protein [Aneurinibacillus migulanus]
MLEAGISQEEWENFAASIGCKCDPISPLAMTALLEEAGFTRVNRYFSSFLIEGYFAFRRD